MKMVLAKTNLFEEEIQESAILYKALAHPARLEILKYLAKIKTCFSGDITHVIPLSRTTVNQHLTELKNAGLIKGSILGSRTKYCINAKKIKDLAKLSNELFDNLTIDENFEC